MSQGVTVNPTNKGVKDLRSIVDDLIFALGDRINKPSLNENYETNVKYFLATKTDNSTSKGDIFVKTERINISTGVVESCSWHNQTRNLPIDKISKAKLDSLLELTDNKFAIGGELLGLTDQINVLTIPNTLINNCKISINEGSVLVTLDGSSKPNSETKTGLLYKEGTILELTSKHSLVNCQICGAPIGKIYVEYYINF